MLVRQLLDPRELVASRGTSLLAVLWLAGGLMVLLAQAVTPGPGLERAVGLAAGGVAVVVGAVLLANRRRSFRSVGYAMLTLLGGMTITVMVWAGGPALAGATATLYVFVCVFSLLTLQRLAVVVIVLSAIGHAAVVAATGHPGWLGNWMMVWSVGLVTGVVVAAVLAGLRTAVAERDATVRELQAADETKTAFLHAVHHELSRPMTALSGLGETLAERGEQLDADRREDLARRIVAQSQRLQGMLDDLLQLGSVDAGGMGADLRTATLGSIAAMGLELSGVEPSEVDLHVEDATVRVDVVRVAHGTANLLTNAVKYGASDEPLALRMQQREGRVRIVVEDRGPGIPPEARERVFEPFTRARDEDRMRGTGVGLSVVRAVARLHGGDAWIDDRPGGGAQVGFEVMAVPDGQVERDG